MTKLQSEDPNEIPNISNMRLIVYEKYHLLKHYYFENEFVKSQSGKESKVTVA